MGAAIISGFIYLLCGAVMLIIGVSQRKSKTPVGFYTGETPPKPEELSDVPAWNRKHGAMWIGYGALLVLCWIAGLFLGDSPLLLLPMLAGPLVPLPFMILYHKKLSGRYRV